MRLQVRGRHAPAFARDRDARADDLVEITALSAPRLRKTGVESGVRSRTSPHHRGDHDPGERGPRRAHGFLLALANAVPARPPVGEYRHAEGNSDAHVKASLVGSSATIVVDRGELVLGTWQGVYLCEFDGPRTRKVLLKLLAG